MILGLLAAMTADEGGLSKEMYGLIGVVIGATGAIIVGLVTGWWKKQADEGTLKLEQHKAAADQRKEAKADFKAAAEAMGTVMLPNDADLEARRQEAVKARRAIIATAYSHQHLAKEKDFYPLLEALSSPSEKGLNRATGLWPNMERAILEKWPEVPS